MYGDAVFELMEKTMATIKNMYHMKEYRLTTIEEKKAYTCELVEDFFFKI